MTIAYPLRKLAGSLLAAGLLTATGAQAQYSWSADFNNGMTPAGMTLRGNAQMTLTSGVSSTSCIALTPAARGMQGDVILPRFWGGDEAPADVTVRFSLKFGGNNNGVLGDGFSLSLFNGIPAVLGDEEGFSPGPCFEFDTYENGEGDVHEGGLGVRWPNAGASRAGWSLPPNRLQAVFPDRTAWYNMEIRAQLTSYAYSVKVNGDSKHNHPEPAGAVPIVYPDGRLILAARTGDAFNSHLIDNLSVDVTPYPIFRQQPAGLQVTSGTSVKFEAQTNFNTLPWRGLSTLTLVSSATSEWQIRHPGGNWTAVPDTALGLLWGPEARPFVVFSNLQENKGLWEGDDPAWSIDGTEVRCVVTWKNGYITATNPATLRLMPQPWDMPGAITAFNAFPQGSASVTFPNEEGKVLRLTPAAPDCLGGFVFDEIATNPQGDPLLVTAFTGSFQFRGSLPTEIRADGFSFNLAGDLPPGLPGGEEGAGTGLTVSFDAYSNGPEDPSGIDVLWKGQRVARIPMTAEQLFDDEWRQCYLRIEADGTLDLGLNGTAYVFNLSLPGWAGLVAPKMSLYGRTGSFWQQQDVRELAVAVTASPLPQPPPVLSIQPAGNSKHRLEWPATGTSQWALFTSSDLVTWTRSMDQGIVSGAVKQVIVDSTISRRFFRLERRSVTTP